MGSGYEGDVEEKYVEEEDIGDEFRIRLEIKKQITHENIKAYF